LSKQIEKKEPVKEPELAKETEEKQKEGSFLKRIMEYDLKDLKKIQDIIQGFLDTIRGVKDVKTRLSPLMEPEGTSIETSARLTPLESQAVAEIHTSASFFDFFSPLKVFAEHRCLTSISIDGKGREEAIGLMGAYGGAEMLKSLGVNIGSSPTDLQRKQSEKKGLFR
jgi:hypothetical protein